MPFAMLYPPNMAALPHMAYPYPHFCNNPNPRFSDTSSLRESTSPRRAATSSSIFSISSTAPPSNPKKGIRSRRPKTLHQGQETQEKKEKTQEKKEKTPISTYVIAALAGCAQYGVAFPMPGPTATYEQLNPTPQTPTRAEQRRRREAAANLQHTWITEQVGATEQPVETEKVRGKKREKIRGCGKKAGNWIARLCGKDYGKEEHSRTQSQSQEGIKIEEKQAGNPPNPGRASSASEATLVETLGQPGEELLVRTRTRVNPARIYTGH